MTQQGLAQAARTSVQWISRVESRGQNLTLSSMVRLANALEVTIVDLFLPPTTSKAGPGRPRKL